MSKTNAARVSTARVSTARAAVRQLLLLVLLVALWVFLWDSFSLLHVLTGLVVAVLVTRLFYLPPVEIPARFNLYHFLMLAGWFLLAVARGGLQVAWIALRPKPVAPGSVIAVELHTRSDLLTTVTAQMSGLIPGTFVTEIDRANSVLYLHVLNCNTQAIVDANVRQTQRLETQLIRAMGSPHDIEVINDWRKQQGKAPILEGWSLSHMRRRT